MHNLLALLSTLAIIQQCGALNAFHFCRSPRYRQRLCGTTVLPRADAGEHQLVQLIEMCSAGGIVPHWPSAVQVIRIRMIRKPL
jgi:hypothetical protein